MSVFSVSVLLSLVLICFCLRSGPVQGGMGVNQYRMCVWAVGCGLVGVDLGGRSSLPWAWFWGFSPALFTPK